ncbi:MAG TPA: hypothetical protein VF032_00160 [Thermoleophilaceae bacterium]
MIGAVVLIIAGIAIYNGLDAASKASGRNRNRSVASYLAQQDQERLRTMDAATLAGYTSNRTVTVAGVSYKVVSSATLVNDSTGAISCTNKSGTAQYLKISSTVTDPRGQNGPVTEDSLMSPKPADGNAAVKVVDRTGVTGVSGVPVVLTEPPGQTTNTDSGGCSLFSFLSNGTQYHVSFALPNYVDVNGMNTVSGPITVVPGTVSITSFQYDKAGTIAVKMVTGAGGTPLCPGVSAFDSHMTINPRVRVFDNTSCDGANPPTATATGLFPFTDQYAVYPGTCTANDPATWKKTSTFAPVLGSGGSVNATFTEPMVNVTVTRNSSAYSAAHVTITENDAGCDGNVFTPPALSSSGTMSIGLPYGKYTICADDGTYEASDTSVNNITTGGDTAAININTGFFGKKGTCP